MQGATATPAAPAAPAAAATTAATTVCTGTRGSRPAGNGAQAQAPCGCTLNSVPRKQVKTGYLMRYRKRMMGLGSWSERWFVLLDDSTLSWYKESTSQRPEGSVRVREAPDLLAVSEYTTHIPNCPTLPKANNQAELLAVGIRRPRSSVKVVWTLARSMEECHEWMTAISRTLPPMPPPRPPPGTTVDEGDAASATPRSKRDDMVSDGAVELPPTLLLNGGGPGALPVVSAASTLSAAPDQLWGGWGQGNGWMQAVMDGTMLHTAILPHVGHQYHLDCHTAQASSIATASTYHSDYGAASAMDMGHSLDIGDVDLGGGIDCMADLCF